MFKLIRASGMIAGSTKSTPKCQIADGAVRYLGLPGSWLFWRRFLGIEGYGSLVYLASLQAVTRLAVIVFCLIGSGCSAASGPIELVGRVLCVPKDHLIPKLPWIKPDGNAISYESGVAIANCLVAGDVQEPLINSTCIFSPAIESIAMWRDDGDRFNAERAGFSKSLLGRIAMSADTTRTLFDQGRLLVMENLKIWSAWYVWRRGGKTYLDPKQSVSAEDELALTCRSQRTRLGAAPGTVRDVFTCHRDFVAQGIHFSYSIVSDSRVPSSETMDHLDRELVIGLEDMAKDKSCR